MPTSQNVIEFKRADSKLFTIPSSLYSWLMQTSFNIQEKYRIIKLILEAQSRNARSFSMTKKDFSILIETSNRETQKETLSMMAHHGIIEGLREDHFQLYFELSPNLVGGDCGMRTSQLSLKFEDPKIYDLQFQMEAVDNMKQENTKEKYNEIITELLAEVTSEKTLEQMSRNNALKKAFTDRIANVKTRITNYEKRNKIKLIQERINLESISRMLSTVKVFDPEAKSYEDKKDSNRIKMSLRGVVDYFYWRLSVKLGLKQTIKDDEAWPSEITAAKDVLRQMPDKDSSFIKGYIDWVLETQQGIIKMHNIRYYVPQYLQAIEDNKFWQPVWEDYIGRSPNISGTILPQNEEELACLFVHTYEKVFGIKYKPINSFKKDISKLKQMKVYLGDNFDKTVRFIIWCLESVFPVQKEKPASPGDLYRFIQDFKDSPTIIKPTQIKKGLKQLQGMLKRAADRGEGCQMTPTEKEVIQELFIDITLNELDEPSKQLIINNKSIFNIIEDRIQVI